MNNHLVSNWSISLALITMAVEKRDLYRSENFAFTAPSSLKRNPLDNCRFDFYGDTVTLESGKITRGEYLAFQEFAGKHQLDFKAGDAAGSKFTFRFAEPLDDNGLEQAYQKHIEIQAEKLADYALDYQQWLKDRQYFRAL